MRASRNKQLHKMNLLAYFQPKRRLLYYQNSFCNARKEKFANDLSTKTDIDYSDRLKEKNKCL